MDALRNASDDADLRRIAVQIAAGERSAETEFVRRFERGLTLLARRHARPNEARVADVVQVSLMNAIKCLREGALRDAEALPAYLRTCVVREVAALYRGVTALHESTDALAQVAMSDTPETVAARAQLLQSVIRTIETLDVPRDRQVLIRFYVHEESREEICTALGIDEGHFRRVLFRARERLQRLMEAT